MASNENPSRPNSPSQLGKMSFNRDGTCGISVASSSHDHGPQTLGGTASLPMSHPRQDPHTSPDDTHSPGLIHVALAVARQGDRPLLLTHCGPASGLLDYE